MYLSFSAQCYNKVDTISLEEVDRLARLPHSVVISCELELNFDTLLREIWEYLSLLRVYTKKRGGRYIVQPLIDVHTHSHIQY